MPGTKENSEITLERYNIKRRLNETHHDKFQCRNVLTMKLILRLFDSVESSTTAAQNEHISKEPRILKGQRCNLNKLGIIRVR